MEIKIFTISFILTSTLLFLLLVPSKLTAPFPARLKLRIPAAPSNASSSSSTYPVTFAYLISASEGDSPKLARLLRALYHPANTYLVHLESGAPESERDELAALVSRDPVLGPAGNVWVVGKPNLVTYRGPTMLGTTLHAMAMLLRTCSWDWFINLSASDYPLVTQDGKPIVIDPALYSHNESELWWAIKQRALPTAFKLYTGSAWMVLSRSFAEYCIVGWDNMPRILLLYYANFVSSPEGYFQTVICNSDDFRNTTANHDLHYITWDNPPKQHPRYLGRRDYKRMVQSNRPFARKFRENDHVLDRIDRDLLKRRHRGFSFGGWCSGGGTNRRTCSKTQSMMDYGSLSPGSGARRLRNLLSKVLSSRNYTGKQCK